MNKIINFAQNNLGAIKKGSMVLTCIGAGCSLIASMASDYVSNTEMKAKIVEEVSKQVNEALAHL